VFTYYFMVNKDVYMFGRDLYNPLTRRQRTECRCDALDCSVASSLYKRPSLYAIARYWTAFSVRTVNCLCVTLVVIKFYRNLLHSCNAVLSDVFFILLNNFSNNCVLQTIFMSKSDATRSVWCAFENYVVLWYFLSVVYICFCVFLLPVFWRIKVFIIHYSAATSAWDAERC